MYQFLTRFLITLLISGVGFAAQAQIITTIAGTGVGNYNGTGGLADTTELSAPNAVTTDTYGNVYVADRANNVVRKISSTGVTTIIAGVPGVSGSYNGDGIPATEAHLSSPTGIAVDNAGNIYIADNANFRVRKVDTAGMISTVAGIGGVFGFGYSGDGGPATSANLFALGVAVDQYSNIFISDGNSAVRKVDAFTGIISTIAGSAAIGDAGDGAAATSAALRNPTSIAIDASGNIYIADYGNNKIRKINTATPAIITTLAGIDSAGFSGDGGLATSAKLKRPYGVCVDGAGNVYFSDQGNNRIRKIATTGIISTYAGGGAVLGDDGFATNAQLSSPAYICISGNNLYVSDSGHNRVREIFGVSATTHICDKAIDTLGATTTGGSWTNSDPSVILFDSAAGAITATTLGTDTLYYIAGINTFITRIVVDPLPYAAAISGTDTLCLGTSANLSDSTSGGIWSTGAAAVATISAMGIVTPVAAGSITVSYTATNGCGSYNATKDIAVVNCTEGVVNTIASAAMAIVVYPDPNQGIFTINITVPNKENIPVVVTDILGKKMQQWIVPANTATSVLLDAPAGVYFLSAITERVVISSKVVLTK